MREGLCTVSYRSCTETSPFQLYDPPVPFYSEIEHLTCIWMDFNQNDIYSSRENENEATMKGPHRAAPLVIMKARLTLQG